MRVPGADKAAMVVGHMRLWAALSLERKENSMVIRSLVMSLVTVALLWSAWPAQAVVVNGGFETGILAGWQTIGDVSLQTAGIGVAPTEGTTMAFLTTLCDREKPGGSVCSTTARELTYSPNNAVPSLSFSGDNVNGVPTLLGGFFGFSRAEVLGLLSPPEIVQRTFPAGEGSAIKQGLTGQAGDQLAFDFYYVTTDPFDEAFVVLVSDTGSTSVTFLNPFSGPNHLPFSGGSTSPIDLYCHRVLPGGNPCQAGDNNRATGWQHLSIGLPNTGTFTVGFGLWEVAEGTQPTAILIDNVTLTAIPEPSTAILLGGGLLLGWLRRRRMRRTPGLWRPPAGVDQGLPG